MTLAEQPATGDVDFYFAESLVSQELSRTHGIAFAAEFLAQFAPEIHLAANRLAQLRVWNYPISPQVEPLRTYAMFRHDGLASKPR